MCAGRKRRVVCENTADSGCHGETDIGVDIYLADCHLSRMTEFIFGDADSIGKLAAESVYFLYIFLRNGRSAVQNYREAGKSLGDFLENIEAERGGTRMPSAFLVHCSGVNLYAPWLVPMAIASESTPVFVTNSSTSSGRVYVESSAET